VSAACGLQDRAKIEWLSRNAIPVRSINIADDDFTDLLPLQRTIGGARIVLLGESGHGDGATFRAKERLIRFLHERMGFDILAWESGFFDCEEMNRALASDMPALQAAQQGVFGVWSEGQILAPLFEYIRATMKTDHPLHQTGFDIQHLGSTAKRILATVDARQRKDVEEFLAAIEVDSHRADAILDRLRAKNQRFLIKSLEGLAAREQPRLNLREAVAHPDYRDRKMGENLVWLAREWYPRSKIVVWAANFHVAHGQETGYVRMGDLVYRELGDAVYSIGFTTYRGEVGTPGHAPSSLTRPTSGSLESLLHATGEPYMLIDFRGLPHDHWLRKPIVARFFNYSDTRSTWPDKFDAMFYSDVMFPNAGAK
jgi:erythromycin esterase